MAGRWFQRVQGFSLEATRFPKLCLTFILLSAADLLMTTILLRTGPHYYESNPVANWILQKWDVAGVTAFKFSVVALVIVIGEFVERRRRGMGRVVLIIGCIATAAVVAYSLKLYLGRVEVPLYFDEE
jgi:hypothetical protein